MRRYEKRDTEAPMDFVYEKEDRDLGPAWTPFRDIPPNKPSPFTAHSTSFTSPFSTQTPPASSPLPSSSTSQSSQSLQGQRPPRTFGGPSDSNTPFSFVPPHAHLWVPPPRFSPEKSFPLSGQEIIDVNMFSVATETPSSKKTEDRPGAPTPYLSPMGSYSKRHLENLGGVRRSFKSRHGNREREREREREQRGIRRQIHESEDELDREASPDEDAPERVNEPQKQPGYSKGVLGAMSSVWRFFIPQDGDREQEREQDRERKQRGIRRQIHESEDELDREASTDEDAPEGVYKPQKRQRYSKGDLGAMSSVRRSFKARGRDREQEGEREHRRKALVRRKEYESDDKVSTDEDMPEKVFIPVYLPTPTTITPPLPINDSLDNQPLILKGHSGQVLTVAFSPSDDLLVSGSDDKTVRLWNGQTGAETATLNDHSGSVRSTTFSPDGSMVASASWDTTIKLWDVGSSKLITTLRGHSGSVWSAAFSPDGALLVSGSSDRTIRLWDVQSKTQVSTLTGHTSDVRFVAFSPDGKRIVSGSRHGSIRLWEVASRTTILEMVNNNSSWVTSIPFSPNGEYLASGCGDTIELQNAATGVPIATMEGHADLIHQVTFSPNGKHLASASLDHTIRLWDVASTSHTSTLTGHSSNVNCVAFFHDGARLASGSSDQTLRIWRVFPEGPINPQRDMFVSNSVGSTQSTSNAQQDTTTSTSISVPPNNDITGSVTLQSATSFAYGGFGELFLGIHVERGKVVLKKPRRLLDDALIRHFLREVDLWCSVSHRYVLPCLGMCKIGLDVYVVSPFIENGDLLSCLAKGKDLNRTKLLYEVAEALAHLHYRGIVHGDVKAQNILLGEDGSALLCDFGLAKAFDTMVTSTESKGAGSLRWMAPELFLDESRSMASDVYSLGITIAEVLSGYAPFQDISNNAAVMSHVLLKDGRPPKEPSHSPEGKPYTTLWETAEKCWVKDAKARPYMAQVLGMLFPLTRETL